jgi:anaerobic magnesium-protoporphyrin IX monomethyl ester cyclase
MGGTPKILLIKAEQNAPTNYHAPPLGIMAVAANLRLRSGADVRIVHQPVAGVGCDDLGPIIREFAPDWVGISAITFESKGLHRAAAVAKDVRKDLTVVAGGPHASFYTPEVMADPNVDYAVLGEGDRSAVELSAALRTGGPFDHIDGLAWRKGGELHVSPQTRFIEELDDLPFPAWDLVDIPAYAKYERMSRIGTRSYMGLFTTRACPYRCVYCHRMFGKRLRRRSPENVMAELRALHDDHGVRDFEIVDDCFNFDLKRAKAIFDLIIASGLKLRLMFPNGVRGDHLDEEFMIKGRAAGVAAMSFGIETASPRLQELLHKNLDLEKVSQAVALARKHHIMTLGFFMLGFPTETAEELAMTIDFAVRSDLHAVNFFAVTPFAGTDLAEWATREGKSVACDFDNPFMGGGFTNLTDLPDRQLKRMRQRGVLRFYARPSRIFSILRDYPDKRGLPRLLGVLFKRLTLKT